jgi:hypothetical protein
MGVRGRGGRGGEDRNLVLQEIYVWTDQKATRPRILGVSPFYKWDDKLTLGVNRALNLFWNSTEDELVLGRKRKR